MRALAAIAKLTCRATLRSYVFHALFFILAAVIFIIPNTVVSDGTAWGLIRISLKYSLGMAGLILSLSTIWSSCFILSNDLETYQMHMVSAKPVSRVTIWLGKFIGVVVLHGTLLFISAMIIFIFTIWQFNRSKSSDEDKARIRNEILVGRRVYMPDMPDFSEQVKEKFKELVKAVDAGASGIPEKLSKEDKKHYLKEMRKQIIARHGEIKKGDIKLWTFRGLDPKQKNLLFLRYRIYVGKISSKDQREAMGIWGARIPIYEDKDVDKQGGKKGPRYAIVAKSPYPEQIMCGVFLEQRLSPAVIDPGGKVTIAFTNLDTGGSPLFFQPGDGPKLMEKRTGFFQNYLRAVFMIFLRIVFLAGLGASAGGLLSMPVAVFLVISYLIIGISAAFIIGIEKTFDFDTEELEKVESASESVSRYASHALMTVVIPMQKFEVSDTIADGELIELSFIGRFIIEIFVLRGLPIFAMAIYLYKRREIGLIIRK
jgi:hypothetical protein